MDTNRENIIAILSRLNDGQKLSGDEENTLETWTRQSPHNKALFDEVVSGRLQEEAQQFWAFYNQHFEKDSIWDKITEKLNYKSNLISDYQENKETNVVEPKIITDVRAINSSVLDMIKRGRLNIDQLEPRAFEMLVAELFTKDGYKVTLTQITRDGGKDLFVLEHKNFGSFLYYAECKKYGSDRPVGVNLVRELYGTVAADGATAGIMVTTSYFSKDAVEFTEKVRHQMSLIDYIKLVRWIERLKL